MRTIVRRLLTLLLAAVVGMILGLVVTGFLMGFDWGVSMILGGCAGVLVGTLYDPRAANYTVPTRGCGAYPGDRDD